MDTLLRTAYPFISEGKGLTSSWAPLVFPFNLKVLPRFLPEGEEDAACLTVGQHRGEPFSLWVWKDGEQAFCKRKPALGASWVWKFEEILRGLEASLRINEHFIWFCLLNVTVLSFSEEMKNVILWEYQYVYVYSGNINVSKKYHHNIFKDRLIYIPKFQESWDWHTIFVIAIQYPSWLSSTVSISVSLPNLVTLQEYTGAPQIVVFCCTKRMIWPSLLNN